MSLQYYDSVACMYEVFSVSMSYPLYAYDGTCPIIIHFPEGGVIPGTFGAELARRPSSSSKDKDKGSGSASNHYHNRVINAEGAADEDEEEGVSGNVDELFAGSLLPPVQLPLDYSTHIKQRTLVAPAKTVMKIKQEHVDDSVEQMDTSEPSAVSKHVQFAKPVVKSSTAEVKSQRITAAELFTPSEVHS